VGDNGFGIPPLWLIAAKGGGIDVDDDVALEGGELGNGGNGDGEEEEDAEEEEEDEDTGEMDADEDEEEDEKGEGEGGADDICTTGE